MKVRTCIEAGIAALVLTVGAGSVRAGESAAGSGGPVSQWLAVARGQVRVKGGMAQVAARTQGVVVSVDARPGQHVEAGQVLAKLDPRAAKIQVATAKAGVAEAKAKLTELQASLTHARWLASHLAAAAKAGAATGTAAAQAQATVATLEAKQAAAEAGLEVARQRLAGAQLELDETTLQAPVEGTVVTRQVAIGQAVAPGPGQPLFTLLPDLPHIVRAQVNAQAAAQLHPGMHAEVQRASGSGPVYSATLLWVGTVLRDATLTQNPLERALADDVECTLKLAVPKPGVVPLPIGQRVIVRFPRQ